MNRLNKLLTTFFLVTTIHMKMFIGVAPEPKFTEEEWMALCYVESRHDPSAVCLTTGKYIGIAQIHRVVVDDLNRNILGYNKFTYSDRLCPDQSRKMFEYYTDHYAGEDATFKDRARIWNGGPNGNRIRATIPYWRKIERIIGD